MLSVRSGTTSAIHILHASSPPVSGRRSRGLSRHLDGFAAKTLRGVCALITPRSSAHTILSAQQSIERLYREGWNAFEPPHVAENAWVGRCCRRVAGEHRATV